MFHTFKVRKGDILAARYLDYDLVPVSITEERHPATVSISRIGGQDGTIKVWDHTAAALPNRSKTRTIYLA